MFLDESTNKQKSIETLKNYNAYLIKAIDESIETKSTVVTNPTFLSTPSFLILQNLRIKERNLIRSGNQLKNFFNAAVDALSSIYVTGAFSIDTGTQLRDSIALRKGNFDTIEPINEYLFLDQVKKEIAERVERTEFTEEIKTALLEYTTHFLLPTIVFSSELTDEETTQAQNNVSRYSGIVNENERIIAKHDRITKDIKLKIESYKEAKGDLIGQGASILQSVGKFFHIGLILSL